MNSPKLFSNTIKQETFVFAVAVILVLLSGVFLSPRLENTSVHFGAELIGFFLIGFVPILYYAVVVFSSENIGNGTIIRGLGLLIISSLPYIPYFLQVVEPDVNDDLGRSLLYAKNMYFENTLWGGDELCFNNSGKHYVTQPGYRYFVLLQILPHGELYRYVFILNIGLFVLSVGLLFLVLQKLSLKTKLYRSIIILVLLLTPAMIKNILLGLPEWIACVLLIFFAYFLILRNRDLPAVFFLALIPFFRQNLLISVCILLFIVLARSQNKFLVAVVFIITLFIPIYHNLYYAETFRFFVDIFHLPFLNNEDLASNNGTLFNYQLILQNVFHYAGFELENGKYSISWIAFFFLPFASYMFVVFIKTFKNITHKFMFIAISFAAIIPALLFANAYYPRFELMNTMVFLTAFFVLVWKSQMSTIDRL